MHTYRQVIYMVLDELKVASDDSHFEEEHIEFLINKHRAFLLKQRYADVRKTIPESNFQSLALPLKTTSTIYGENGITSALVTTKTVPDIMSIATPILSTGATLSSDITYVPRHRFRYVGENKWLKDLVYATIAPNNHIYIKSKRPNLSDIQEIVFTAVFSNSSSVFELLYNADEGPADHIDNVFPLEDALIPPLVELTVKELLGKLFNPVDDNNNAKDDLSDVNVGR